MPPSPVPVAAVVPVFNKAEFLRASLDSIVASARRCGGVEIVLVDHCSTDGSYEMLDQYRDAAIVTRMRGGTISSVRNAGVRQTTAPIICFIDADCVVPPGYFDAVRAVLAETGADAVGCEYDIPSNPHWSERVWYDLHVIEEDGERHYINGGNLAARRSVLDAVGGFDERLETGEDTDLCARLRARGHRIFESRRLSVVHLGNPKSLAAFYRKQVWHGLGIPLWTLGTSPNKATVMTLAYAFDVVLALGLLALPIPLSLTARTIAAALLVLAVPVATVAYRFAETRRLTDPVRATVLYAAFYLARARALAALLLGRGGVARASAAR